MLHIYNTLSHSKQLFEPITPGKVRMYVCGMTVYDYCHLGHARVLVVFDLVVRYLRWLGYEVTYVRNVTDIDDKIIARAAENGESVDALTARFIDAMHEDAEALGVLAPDREPRATGHIDLMLDMIARLIDKGMAYAADNGDVYFDVSEFEGYGKLSGKAPEDLRSGARIEINEAKDDPLDFVLWKAAKPGEPQWPSPWGAGRPGWHIECSAMSTQALGDHFDIHGGGMDLQFPHHENEIAQSEGCTGRKFVNYWMHNGFVRINEEKMSKSLGNFFTVRELLKQYRPEELRYFILASHYRSPLNYGDDQIDAVASGLNRLYTALRGLPVEPESGSTEYEDRFRQAMDDDFNSALAIAVLHELAGEINRRRESDPILAAALGATLKRLGAVLGLLEQQPDAYLKSRRAEDALTNEQIDQAIADRIQARNNKNWAEADRLRDLLKDAGVILEDGASGTVWRRER